MDKEKEIEGIACIISGECKSGCGICSILSEYGCSEYDNAKKLINAGYGNVKQAVKEFAERLKVDLTEVEFGSTEYWACVKIIDELIKERFGE